MSMETIKRYSEYPPSPRLSKEIDSFWYYRSLTNEVEHFTVTPDGFPKIYFVIKEGEISNYIKTGLWTEPKEITLPENSTVIGCRFTILAPEYLFHETQHHLLDTSIHLPFDYLNADTFSFDDFELSIQQWQDQMIKLRGNKVIAPHKLKLAKAIYETGGSIRATELANRVNMTNRTINRYLNKYCGVSLKTYLNILRGFDASAKLKSTGSPPTEMFYDQPHFIRHIKRHTGTTPRKFTKKINDQFIQFLYRKSR